MLFPPPKLASARPLFLLAPGSVLVQVDLLSFVLLRSQPIAIQRIASHPFLGKLPDGTPFNVPERLRPRVRTAYL